MADQENDTLVLGRQFGQGKQRLPDTGIAGELNGRVQEGHDGIDDHQRGARLGQNPVEGGNVGGDQQRQIARAAFAVQHEDPVEVGTQGTEARDDGVVVAVLAVDDDDVGRVGTRTVVGKGPAGTRGGHRGRG